MSSMPASGPQAAPRKRRILLVDDDVVITRSLARALHALSSAFEIETATSGAEALNALSDARFDAVITDLQMPGLSGTDWVARLRGEHPELLCLVHSSQLESFGEDEVRRLAHACFAKPTSPQALIAALEHLWALRGELTHLGLRSA